MEIEIESYCHQGKVRENNEDMILINTAFIRNDSYTAKITLSPEQRYVVAIADGMGGHNGGEVASEMVVKDFSRFFHTLPSGLSVQALTLHLENWVQDIHCQLIKRGKQELSLENMGTTWVALLIYEHKVFWLNCGDSRLYRFRNHILCQLTTDHSLQEMTGIKSVASNIITNSIGAGKRAFLDIKEITTTLYPHDLFLLCSDGLSDSISDEQIEKLLTTSSIKSLVDASLQAGGKDNISVCSLSVNSL